MRQSWEVLGFGEASSVVGLLGVPSNMRSVSEWDLDCGEACLFTWDHWLISAFVASVNAEVIASVDHGSHVLIDVSKLGFVEWLCH